MAEVMELFPNLDEEEETNNAEEKEYEYHFWSYSVIPNLFDPVFSSSRRSSSDSEESSIAASDCSNYHLSLFHDFSYFMYPPRPFDPYPETLDSRDFRVPDAVHDFPNEGNEGAVENLLFVGGRMASDSSEHDRVIAAADCDTSGRGPDRAPDDLGLTLGWGFIPIDDARRNSGEEFEWEEVGDRLDDRGVLTMMVDIDDDETSRGRGEVVDEQLVPEEASGEVDEDGFIDISSVIWEVISAMNYDEMTRNNSENTIEHVGIPDFEDDQVFINLADYEFQIAQFTDHDYIVRGNPPAAKLIVDELPSIILTEEDVANSSSLCAVCKDAFSPEERAKQLPCSHLYHYDCILPWLGIRNTCPVCRYELQTDDPEYERLKGRTRAGGAAIVGSLLRSAFEIFPGV